VGGARKGESASSFGPCQTSNHTSNTVTLLGALLLVHEVKPSVPGDEIATRQTVGFRLLTRCPRREIVIARTLRGQCRNAECSLAL